MFVSGEKICVGKTTDPEQTKNIGNGIPPLVEHMLHSTTPGSPHSHDTESPPQESCPVGVAPSQGDSHHQDDITSSG